MTYFEFDDDKVFIQTPFCSVNPITEKHSFQMATHTPVQVNFDSSCDVIKDGPLARFVRRKKS